MPDSAMDASGPGHFPQVISAEELARVFGVGEKIYEKMAAARQRRRSAATMRFEGRATGVAQEDVGRQVA